MPGPDAAAATRSAEEKKKEEERRRYIEWGYGLFLQFLRTELGICESFIDHFVITPLCRQEDFLRKVWKEEN